MRNGKRIFASSFKAWLVEQASGPGTSVAGLAMRHSVNANQLRRWMKLQRDWPVSPAPLLLPVTISSAAPPVAPADEATDRSPAPIEIELAGAVVRVHRGVDPQQLRLVLQALRA
ncbi:MAG: transposase [Caldimonas sp.]